MTYSEIVERRRALRIPGYATLSEAGLEGEWITPYQISSRSSHGPVLVAFNWFDLPSARKHREKLLEQGYLEGIVFNRVMDLALADAGIARSDIYMTQAFHLLPAKRSQRIPTRHVDFSFDSITRHELYGRRVIAIGADAAGACRRHGVKFSAVAHLSARGQGLTFKAKSQALAKALIGSR